MPLPATIGRFKVEALLGAGGMGEVYKAYDATLHRTIAVKTVRPDINNPSYLERLYREAQAVARLQHPNIVTVFEAGEMDGLVYIAMEYLKGENLAAALERGTLSFEVKIKIVIQILEALQFAHTEGVIHRDIKPANVHRLPDGSIKLLDFGLARITRADSLTATGAVMGTPYYASPEQLKGEAIDARTDIYSAGVLAYELLTGRHAFEGENLSTVMLKVLSEPPPPMQTSWTNTFPEIERIITRAMAKLARDRYATAEDMRNALAAFMAASREALAGVQAEQTIYAQRAVFEAKSLIAKGEVGQAQELLTQALRANPEAIAARTLLRDTTAGGAPPKVDAAPASPPQPKAPAIAADPTMVRARPQGAAAEPPAHGQKVPAPPSPLMPPPPPRPVEVAKVVVRDIPAPRRTIMWAIAAAAVVVVSVAGWMISNRTDVPPPGAGGGTAAGGGTVAGRGSAAGGGTTAGGGAEAGGGTVAGGGTAGGATAAGGEATAGGETVAGGGNVTAAGTTAGGARVAGSATSLPGGGVTGGVTPATGGADKNSVTKGGSAAPSEAGAAAGSKPFAAASTENASAKKLFVENASRNLGLRYAMVQQTAGGEAEVTPDTIFHTGDKVRFLFESNIDGYLYVVQEGSSGKWDMLFPSPQINGGANAVRKGQKYTIPSQGWFAFRDPPGAERAFVFLSKEPLNSLPGFKEPVTRNEAVGQGVVDDLRSKIKSRDLVFEKDSPVASGTPGQKNQSMFVANRDELGKSVSATIQLVHQ
jgi:predicted Ser/Thr protein kinase